MFCFFQISLLIGYFYSYLVSRKLSLKRQIILHCSLLFIALWAINFHFQAEVIDLTKPISGTLFVLAKNIFIPFVLLSTTSPLVQHWLSASNLKERKNPYMLYVCSNIGSLMALYAYPLFFEKSLTLSLQGTFWHVVFVLFFCFVVVIGTYLNRTIQEKTIKTEEKTGEKINGILIFYWIFFAFIPSSLMLGVTSHLSTDIGGLPFLWIFPLSLYLISFIWTFSKFYNEEIAKQFQRLYKIAAVLTIFLFLNTSVSSNLTDNISLIGAEFIFYFIFAMYCHGVLSSKKPTPQNLTLFYLCLSVGGALGGIFNTFIAPNIFLSIWEYPFVIALSLPFVLSNLSEKKGEFLKILRNVLILTIIVIASIYIKVTIDRIQALILFYVGLGLTIVFAFLNKKSFSLLCLISIILLQLFFIKDTNVIYKKRNFFGTIMVQKQNIISGVAIYLTLLHGDTIHGKQTVFLPNSEGKEERYGYNPSTYYGNNAAVADFFNVFKRDTPPVIAWLGLGSGAIICYAQPDTKHDIIEIDQDIADVSRKYHYFRYLEHCAPQADLKIGDARIEMSKTNQKYDLVVLDAFSSHFIPVHLVTKEAIEVYRSKLKSDGLILLHISSRAFDIEPILTKIAEDLGMTFIVRYNAQFDFDYPQWGVLASSDKLPEIQALLSMPGWRKGKMDKNTPVWTDDFHNLLSVLRRQ